MITLSHNDMLGTWDTEQDSDSKMTKSNHASYVLCCMLFSYKKLWKCIVILCERSLTYKWALPGQHQLWISFRISECPIFSLIKTLFLTNLFYCFLCTHAHACAHIHATVLLQWSEDNFQESVCSFHHRFQGLNSDHPACKAHAKPSHHPGNIFSKFYDIKL